MPGRLIAIATLGAALAAPALASADVEISVPTEFLGGDIWNPAPVPAGRNVVPGAVAGGPASAPADACRPGEADCVVLPDEDAINALTVADVTDPNLALLFDLPLPEPTDDVDGQGPADPADGTPEDDTPPDPAPAALSAGPAGVQAAFARRRPAPVALPAVGPDVALSYGRLVHPGPASWLRWQQPVLRWRGTKGADLYNVQIFRGGRRVLAAWTGRTALRVPEDVLRQGRTYVWVVWPGEGSPRDARYGSPLGRSTFAVTLRPRIVFRTPGAGGGTVGEVRPRIPGGVIALYGGGRAAARIPDRIRVGASGLFTLPVPRRTAERLGASLIERGPRPPVGLRG